MPLLDLNPMPPTRLDYPVIIEPLAAEDGGGFIAAVPDLPGCMSDGETPEEALTNVRDAIAAWLDEARALGRPIPTPSHGLAAAE
ncbi:MAG TPA: type II toxin-antitoxin system HicB family antitoxin [Xanthobacteraceae bacterium]|jgi:antitoxin HicB|nr:type II toxin-antitoxin system HicB family antitoxin [Xanthobacteraceae bacterium]